MRRFYLSPDAVQGRRMVFSGKDARYISKVLRLKRGESIIGFDGDGREYIGTIAILSPRRVEAVITEKETTEESYPCHIALAQAVLKSGGLDKVVRPAVELGISDFYPLLTRHSIPRLKKNGEKKLERWRKISLDAVRQSGRKLKPIIHPFLDWRRLLTLPGEFNIALLPWEGEKRTSLKSVLREFPEDNPPKKILIAIGPEGGFTVDEIAGAVEAGFVTVSIGANILRATTAGIATVACLQYEFGEGVGRLSVSSNL